MFKNKKSILTLVMMLVISISLAGCGNKGKGSIAKVNGEEIKREDFDREYNAILDINKKQYGEEALKKEVEGKKYEDMLKEQIFNFLVDEKIMSQDLEKLEIGVTDKEIEDAMKEVKEFRINQLGGNKEYEEFLKKNGFTEEYLKVNMKRVLMRNKHREEFFKKTNIKDDEIKKYYEANKDEIKKYRVSHILVKDEKDGNKILEELKSGKKFNELAAKKSLDKQTIDKGGEFGYVAKGELAKKGLPQIEEEAFKLGRGEYSKLIKTDLGYHIVYVGDIRDTLPSLKEDIINNLKFERYTKYVEELKSKAEIEVVDKEFKF